MFCRGGFYARPAACGVALYGRFAKRPYEAARTIMDAVGNMAEDRKNKGSDEAPFVCVFFTMRWAAARAAPTDSCLGPFFKGPPVAWPALRRR